MKWNYIGDLKPHDRHYDEENPARFVECLVKLKGISERNDLIRVALYEPSTQRWYVHGYDTPYRRIDEYETVEYWQYLDLIDVSLTNGYDRDWCWEFGATLAEVAVPALSHWIENGVSHPHGMSHEEWKHILTEIRDSFEESRKILNGDYDDLPNEQRDNIIELAEKNREHAFMLLAKYYLDMWD